jgi:hypothetical protein
MRRFLEWLQVAMVEGGDVIFGFVFFGCLFALMYFGG